MSIPIITKTLGKKSFEKLGGLSKAEIMKMVSIPIITRTYLSHKALLGIFTVRLIKSDNEKFDKLGGLSKDDIMEMVTSPIISIMK